MSVIISARTSTTLTEYIASMRCCQVAPSKCPNNHSLHIIFAHTHGRLQVYKKWFCAQETVIRTSTDLNNIQSGSSPQALALVLSSTAVHCLCRILTVQGSIRTETIWRQKREAVLPKPFHATLGYSLSCDPTNTARSIHTRALKSSEY